MTIKISRFTDGGVRAPILIPKDRSLREARVICVKDEDCPVPLQRSSIVRTDPNAAYYFRRQDGNSILVYSKLRHSFQVANSCQISDFTGILWFIVWGEGGVDAA